MAPIRATLTWQYRGWLDGAPFPTWRLTLPDGTYAEVEARQDNGKPWTLHHRISFNGGIQEGHYATRDEAQAIIYRRLGIGEDN